MSYYTGQILNSDSSNNLWVVVDSATNEISLLWDSWLQVPVRKLNKQLMPTSMIFKLCSRSEAEAIIGGFLPDWADKLVAQYELSARPGYSPIAVTLTPGAFAKAAYYLGMQMKKSLPKVLAPETDQQSVDICPSNGYHIFVSYTGLNESFEYCVHCDVKRRSK